MAAILTARPDDPGVALNVVATPSAVLSKLGATPVDSSKVAALAQEVRQERAAESGADDDRGAWHAKLCPG